MKALKGKSLAQGHTMVGRGIPQAVGAWLALNRCAELPCSILDNMINTIRLSPEKNAHMDINTKICTSLYSVHTLPGFLPIRLKATACED